jgi:hypothetical protein
VVVVVVVVVVGGRRLSNILEFAERHGMRSAQKRQHRCASRRYRCFVIRFGFLPDYHLASIKSLKLFCIIFIIRMANI